MEVIINTIAETLALTDAQEQKSLSIFDENDNKICGIGKPKVTEKEAVIIHQCLTNSWEGPVRIKVGKVNYLCLKVSNTLLGYGNFNEDFDAEESNSKHFKIVSDNDHVKRFIADSTAIDKESAEKFTLSALLVKNCVVILMGRAVDGDSLLKEIKKVAQVLNTLPCNAI